MGRKWKSKGIGYGKYPQSGIMKYFRKKKKLGFTIIELIVSIGVSSIIFTVMLNVFTSGVATSSAGQSKLFYIQDISMLFLQMREDFHRAVSINTSDITISNTTLGIYDFTNNLEFEINYSKQDLTVVGKHKVTYKLHYDPAKPRDRYISREEFDSSGASFGGLRRFVPTFVTQFKVEPLQTNNTSSFGKLDGIKIIVKLKDPKSKNSMKLQTVIFQREFTGYQQNIDQNWMGT